MTTTHPGGSKNHDAKAPGRGGVLGDGEIPEEGERGVGTGGGEELMPLRRWRRTTGEDAVGPTKESVEGPSMVRDHVRRRSSGGEDGDSGVAR